MDDERRRRTRGVAVPTRQVFTREDDGICAATRSRRAETEETVIADMVVRSFQIGVGVGCAPVAEARRRVSGDVARALLVWWQFLREGGMFTSYNSSPFPLTSQTGNQSNRDDGTERRPVRDEERCAR